MVNDPVSGIFRFLNDQNSAARILDVAISYDSLDVSNLASNWFLVGVARRWRMNGFWRWALPWRDLEVGWSGAFSDHDWMLQIDVNIDELNFIFCECSIMFTHILYLCIYIYNVWLCQKWIICMYLVLLWWICKTIYIYRFKLLIDYQDVFVVSPTSRIVYTLGIQACLAGKTPNQMDVAWQIIEIHVFFLPASHNCLPEAKEIDIDVS